MPARIEHFPHRQAEGPDSFGACREKDSISQDALHFNARPMDPRGVAAYLHLDDKTITRWARQGYIPAHPLGQGKKKYWRFFQHEIDAWLNDQTNEAVAA